MMFLIVIGLAEKRKNIGEIRAILWNKNLSLCCNQDAINLFERMDELAVSR